MTSPQPLQRSVLYGVLLGIAGFIVNWFNLELFFNVDFLFGSVITMFALMRYGLSTGILAALIASTCTYHHWNQPYAIIIFTIEALLTGWFYRAKRQYIVTINLIYWLIPGLAMVLVFYHTIMGFGWEQSFLIAIKQGVNGVLNTLVASSLYIAWRYWRAEKEDLPSFRQLTFVAIAVTVLLPVFLLMYSEIRNTLSTKLLEHQNLSLQSVRSAKGVIDGCLIPQNAQIDKRELAEFNQLLNNIIQPNDMSAIIVDTDGKIIVSTSDDLQVGTAFKLPENGELLAVGDGVNHWVPIKKAGIGAAKRWKASFYIAELPLNVFSGGKVIVQTYLKPTLNDIERQTSKLLMIIAFLTAVIVLFSRFTSSWLNRMILQLAKIAEAIPDAILTDKKIEYPDSRICELERLSISLKQMQQTIYDSDKAQKKLNENLEEQVAARTVQLEQSRDMWLRTFNTIPDIITILDLNHNILHANKAMIDAMDNYRGGCELGLPCYKVVHDLDAPPEYCPHSKLILDSLQHEEEVYEPLLAKYLTVTVTPFFDYNGKLIGSIHVAHDISERKRWEIEMEREKNRAEAATVAKSQFLATMSHEIRTPMNGIIGMTSLLLGSELTENQRESAEIVRQSSNVLLRLINDILDFSKIEAGMMQLTSESVELRELVWACREVISVNAAEKGIELAMLVEPNVPKIILGDSLRLKQIIINLLGNALKFTERGSITLQAKVVSESNDLLTAMFSVNDSGIGIEHDKLDHIFDSFSQADGSTTRKYGGTGLGLAICKQLVHLMGGEIGVESVVDKGSRFWFTAVFKKLDEELMLGNNKNDKIREVIQIKGEDAVPIEHTTRILMAEDDPINQMVAKAYLKKLGYEFDLADNGLRAIELLESNVYDIVFMDCMMPKMGGFEATAIIRNSASKVLNHAITIVALTANAVSGDREKCLEAGMDDYMSKPFDIEEMRKIVKRWTEK